MKQFITLSILLFVLPLSYSQSNFDQEEFLLYRESIKEMTTLDLMGKYAPQNAYYSNRRTPTALENITYLDSVEIRYGLTVDEKNMLEDNHFVVSERLSYRSLAQSILDIYYSDLPLFLSTDLFLHALHSSYDAMLKEIEYSLLETNLVSLLSGMRDEIDLLYSQNNTVPELKQAIEDADLFLAIGLSLLKDESILPKYDNTGIYNILLDEILKEDPGMIQVSLFSEHQRRFDASQFTPRGHYTEIFYVDGLPRDLKNYFRVMMWLGRADFFLTPPPVAGDEPPWSDEDILRMNLGSVVMNEVLNRSGEKDLLRLHEKIIGFFVGPDDNISPNELYNIIETKGITLTGLLDSAVYEEFQAEINSSDDYGQKIMSNFFIVDADNENAAELPISYKLLGQKFIIDSYVFSQVVYDRVYHNDAEVMRMMPDPLDVMFVLGNEDALPLLEEELDKYHYSYKLEELRYLVEAYDTDFWEQSLYNTWLSAIRELNPPEDKSGYPYFMNTVEWQIEKLNTQLSSWTELRHDNVLYAKQSYTGGTGCSFPHVYIEPYPGFYETLYNFSTSAANFFSVELNEIELDLKENLTSFYESFGNHMLKLKELSEKELRQEVFNEEDLSYLKTFVNDAMVSGPSISGWYMDLFYDEVKGLAEDYLVVDVYTQPTDEAGNEVGNVLHVGTGDLNLGVFCAGSPSNSYQLMAFVGPVLSYHEKVEADWKRLNDEEWGEFFEWGAEVKRPLRPGWAYQYLADIKGNAIDNDEEPNLIGVEFLGTGTENYLNQDDIAYLLAFPNPAEESSMLRFILNKKNDLKLEVYDSLGRQIFQENYKNMPVGEHSIILPLGSFERGLYYVKMNAGRDKEITKLIVN